MSVKIGRGGGGVPSWLPVVNVPLRGSCVYLSNSAVSSRLRVFVELGVVGDMAVELGVVEVGSGTTVLDWQGPPPAD